MLNVTNTDDDGLEVRRSGYMRVSPSDSFGREKDKELALELTKLCFENHTSAEDPLDVLKRYWRELATMV